MEILLDNCPFCGEIPTLPDGDRTQYEIECDCGMACSNIQISDLMTIVERNSQTITFNNPRYDENLFSGPSQKLYNDGIAE